MIGDSIRLKTMDGRHAHENDSRSGGATTKLNCLSDEMKLNPNLSVVRLPSLLLSSRRPIRYPSITSKSPSLKPQTPLFLRPPTFSASLSEFQKWHTWAKTLASSVGSSFARLDNGPDTSLLCRELNWLVEDSLEDPSLVRQLGSQNNLRDLKLKASLDELYCIWRQRIEERRPFQYIVGCEHWRDFVLCVQEGVLIPRPETELIVDLVIDAVRKRGILGDGLWADLGTGSGALAIGVAKVLGHYGKMIAVDLSPVAVVVAAYNVQRYDLQDVIEVKEGSWFEPLKDVKGKLSGIVSNPPYIPTNDIYNLQAEVGQHEPRLALDGGVDGIDDLLYLIDGAASMLMPGGFFAFECNGERQCKFLMDYIENDKAGSFCNIDIVSDFAGVERFVTGYRL